MAGAWIGITRVGEPEVPGQRWTELALVVVQHEPAYGWGVSYRDDELLAVLPHARGYDRQLLVLALGDAVEVDSAGAAGELARLLRTEKANLRNAALYSLGKRLGEAATSYETEALHSTSWGLQLIAADLLADYGGRHGADELFAWFDRKLRAKDRTSYEGWGRYDLLIMIRFAVRHGMHGELAHVLAARWDRLAGDERVWLERYWPGMFDAAGHPRVDHDAPPPIKIGRWMEDELHSPYSEEQKAEYEAAGAAHQAERIADAYARARRRMEKAAGSR